MRTITPNNRATDYNDWMNYIHKRTKEILGYQKKEKIKLSPSWDKNVYNPKKVNK